jgi:conjugal transfer/entry exclusion protein
MTDEMAERLTIREMVENWVLWRDANQWQKFRSLWHDDGRMMATWTQGTADEFIEMSKAGFAKGVRILHFLGGSTIEVRGNRSTAIVR